MSYNIGDTFIIKIGAKRGTYYQMEGTDYYFPERMLDKLQRYDDDLLVKSVYAEGANDAWDAARKIVGNPTDGGISCEDLRDVFGTVSYTKALFGHTAYEAIEKIHEWEKKKKEDEKIRVGDEINCNGRKGVLIYLNFLDLRYKILWEEGVVATGTTGWEELFEARTGRHFSEFDEIMKKLQENDDAKH